MRDRGAGDSFAGWIKDARLGDTAAVVVYDHQGEPVRRYRLGGAALTHTESGPSIPDDANALTEKLVISYEHMEIA